MKLEGKEVVKLEGKEVKEVKEEEVERNSFQQRRTTGVQGVKGKQGLSKSEQEQLEQTLINLEKRGETSEQESGQEKSKANDRGSIVYQDTGKVSTLPRHHPANEEEHKENRSQAEQLRILVGGGGHAVPKQEERSG